MTKNKLMEEFKKLGLDMTDKAGGHYYEVRNKGSVIYSFSTIQRGAETLLEEKEIQKNLIKIKLDNMSESNKIHYIYGLELEENKVYEVMEYGSKFYKLVRGAKRGLWIEKEVCTTID